MQPRLLLFQGSGCVKLRLLITAILSGESCSGGFILSPVPVVVQTCMTCRVVLSSLATLVVYQII